MTHNVVLASLPMVGHVNPLRPIARALVERGHDVRWYTGALFAASVEARVRVRLLEPLAAAPDHPVAMTHPQGEYLKGWWIEVQGPWI